MAYINDPGGGRTGPYWRRQLGITGPNERTGAQLRMINLARMRLGLEPEGGPARRRAVPAGGTPGFVGRPIDGAKPVQRPNPFGPGLGRGYHPQEPGGDALVPNDPNDPTVRLDPIENPGQQVPGATQGGGNGVGPGGFEGQLPNPQQPDLEALRRQLLQQFHGAIQPNYSRDALRQYAQQHLQRRAVGGQPRKPILPQRNARKAMPY